MTDLLILLLIDCKLVASVKNICQWEQFKRKYSKSSCLVFWNSLVFKNSLIVSISCLIIIENFKKQCPINIYWMVASKLLICMYRICMYRCNLIQINFYQARKWKYGEKCAQFEWKRPFKSLVTKNYRGLLSFRVNKNYRHIYTWHIYTMTLGSTNQ